MYKQKIGISVGDGYGAPIEDVLRIIKNAGFDAISPTWREPTALEDLAFCAKELGLLLQSLHAPFRIAADMWSREESVSVPALEELKASLDACVKYEIPVLVVHTWIGFGYTFDGSDLCYESFDELVRYAKARGVKIAFENTEGIEYLSSLMTRYEGDDTVGFCWDSGHEMCYNYSEDMLARYGDRLLMTHLNDNLGISRFDGEIFWTDDLHLLPYDGVADWDNNVERLRKARPILALNFELNISSKPNRHENDAYEQMPLTSYFAEAYKRACRIAYRYAK